ncbi:unnamed protein product [Mortierella alpina]
MTDQGKAILAGLQEAAKKALSPTTSKDYTVYNALAIVHVEQSRITNRLGRAGDVSQAQRVLHGSPGSLSQSVSARQPAPVAAALAAALAAPQTLPGVVKVYDLGDIFLKNVAKPWPRTALPQAGDRINTTLQLAYCVHLSRKMASASLPSSHGVAHSSPFGFNAAEKAWMTTLEDNSMTQGQLHWLATKVVSEFLNRTHKDPVSIAEGVILGSVLGRNEYRTILSHLIETFEKASLLDIELLQGLVQLLQAATPEYLETDDLVRTLRVLRKRLKDTHQPSETAKTPLSDHIYQLTVAVSRVLDVMVGVKVKGLNRIEDHQPLFDVLAALKNSPDPYLKFQVSNALQALQYIPDDESPLEACLRFAGGLTMGVLGVASVFKLDPSNLFSGLDKLMQAAGQAHDVAKAIVEGAKFFRAGGEGSINNLVEGFRRGTRKAWYIALQGARVFIREGQLADFKRVLLEAPCRDDPDFQWGMCQLLGEVAFDPYWEIDIRQQAVYLLSEIYTNDACRYPTASLRTWILIILCLVLEANRAIKGPSAILQQDLDKAKAEAARISKCYLLRTRLPLPEFSPLFTQAQDIPPVEYDLHQLKYRRIKEYKQPVYIPPLAKASLQVSDNDASSLMAKIKEFLEGEQQVFLVLGDSGAGKSTFNRHLESELWKKYSVGGPIPLFINLPAVSDHYQDMIGKQLQLYDFAKSQIKELRKHRQMILICDGYDETQLKINLHTANKLNQEGQANTKMIISCRSIYLGRDYRNLFQPQPNDRYSGTAADLYTEVVIVPFSTGQIEDYVGQFVRDPEVHKQISKSRIWSTEDYMSMLRSIPNMMDLVKNPFLLSLALRSLPLVVEGAADLSKVKVTRLTLYNAFTDQWLENNKCRLENMTLSAEARDALQELLEEGFASSAIDFLKELAAAIFKEQNGNPVVQYTPRSDNGTWKCRFFGPKSDTVLLRESSPLSRAGTQHRFMHRSLLEYFYARCIYEVTATGALMSESGSNLATHPLSQTNLVKELSIIDFLAEHVQTDPKFEQNLHQIVDMSKSDGDASQAAANAITILVRAGTTFNGADLRGIQIRGADLSGGQFDSAQLQGANLRDTNLGRIWLRQADLSDTQMAGAQFGEWPFLVQEDEVLSCAYAPDGKTFAAGLANGTISMYTTTTWTKTRTLSGHTSKVRSVVFSPDGQQIASGSEDMTIRLWDAHSGALAVILNGHAKSVYSIVFSPNGQQIASTSGDFTVRLWDARSGAPGVILSSFPFSARSVVFSPNGQQMASVSQNRVVRVWDARSGALGVTLIGHTSTVTSVVFSPDGQQIASGSHDKTVRLWDAQSGSPGAILSGHTSYVESVVFSPNGLQIASSSSDKTVRLWDAQSGSPDAILSGHTSYVESVVFSPNGLQIASSSSDKTVRIWDARSGAAAVVLGGHTGFVSSVEFSLSGQQIVSGSWDKTVRIWDAQSGALGLTLSGHDSYVWSAVFSPNGQQIASGSEDCTVRLWDTQSEAPGVILSGHTKAVHSGVFSPDGQQIASGSHDKTVRLWNAQSGASDVILSGHADAVSNVVFSPNGQQIASGSHDKTVRLWDARSGALGVILTGHTSTVGSVAFSPNGQQIVSGSWDNTVRLWDAQSGSPGAILSGHTYPIWSVVFSPNGEQIASGSDDNTVRRWDVESGQCMTVVRDFPGEISRIAWKTIGTNSYLATGTIAGATSIAMTLFVEAFVKIMVAVKAHVLVQGECREEIERIQASRQNRSCEVALDESLGQRQILHNSLRHPVAVMVCADILNPSPFPRVPLPITGPSPSIFSMTAT